MIKEVFVCAHCGKELDEMSCHHFASNSGHYDLCLTCKKELTNLIGQFCKFGHELTLPEGYDFDE